MQIVIDISKKLYDRYKEKDHIKRCDIDEFEKALDSCVILPKGHGRLGDLDALEKLCTEYNIANSAYDNSPIIEQGHYSDGDCIWKPLFEFAPTIIEADKEA